MDGKNAIKPTLTYCSTAFLHVAYIALNFAVKMHRWQRLRVSGFTRVQFCKVWSTLPVVTFLSVAMSLLSYHLDIFFWLPCHFVLVNCVTYRNNDLCTKITNLQTQDFWKKEFCKHNQRISVSKTWNEYMLSISTAVLVIFVIVHEKTISVISCILCIIIIIIISFILPSHK